MVHENGNSVVERSIWTYK